MGLLWGRPKVFRQSFFMRVFGSSSAKRTTLWSNSRAIRKFSTAGKYHPHKGKRRPLANHYVDLNGKRKFQGRQEELKKSQYLDKTVGIWFVIDLSVFSCIFLSSPAKKCTVHLRAYPLGFGRRFCRCMKLFHREKAPVKTLEAIPEVK